MHDFRRRKSGGIGSEFISRFKRYCHILGETLPVFFSRYVFVEFASQDDANAALSKAGDLKIGGKPIKAEICSQRMTEGLWPSSESYHLSNFKQKSLHVSALLRCTTENELKDLFPGAKSIDLPNAGPGKSIGYAPILYINENVFNI